MQDNFMLVKQILNLGEIVIGKLVYKGTDRSMYQYILIFLCINLINQLCVYLYICVCIS